VLSLGGPLTAWSRLSLVHCGHSRRSPTCDRPQGGARERPPSAARSSSPGRGCLHCRSPLVRVVTWGARWLAAGAGKNPDAANTSAHGRGAQRRRPQEEEGHMCGSSARSLTSPSFLDQCHPPDVDSPRPRRRQPTPPKKTPGDGTGRRGSGTGRCRCPPSPPTPSPCSSPSRAPR